MPAVKLNIESRLSSLENIQEQIEENIIKCKVISEKKPDLLSNFESFGANIVELYHIQKNEEQIKRLDNIIDRHHRSKRMFYNDCICKKK